MISISHGRFVPTARAMLLATLLAAGAITSACATMYVDNGLPEVPPERMPKVAQASPVQLLFEFRTKGTLNTRATDFLKDDVAEITRKSGLFSSVSNEPISGAGVLSLVIDNVPITGQSDAAAKGFVTGLTFGLAGSAVSDGYTCTADYVLPAGNTRLKKEVRHAIHTTVGAKGAPANSTKAKNMEAAARTMTSQIVSNALSQLAEDPAFAAAGASPP